MPMAISLARDYKNNQNAKSEENCVADIAEITPIRFNLILRTIKIMLNNNEFQRAKCELNKIKNVTLASKYLKVQDCYNIVIYLEIIYRACIYKHSDIAIDSLIQIQTIIRQMIASDLKTHKPFFNLFV
jgi:hypothetical protein